mgnify:CR=1 FL=1
MELANRQNEQRLAEEKLNELMSNNKSPLAKAGGEAPVVAKQPSEVPLAKDLKIKDVLAKAVDTAAEHMFLKENPFKEVANNPEYFMKNKQGLQTKVVAMKPQDYIKVVEDKQPLHKKYGAQESKLLALKQKYDEGTLVDMPYLAFGARDEPSKDFMQEGYHRATNALYYGIDRIPVAIRYREGDKNIPTYIKNYLNEDSKMNRKLLSKEANKLQQEESIRNALFRIIQEDQPLEDNLLGF